MPTVTSPPSHLGAGRQALTLACALLASVLVTLALPGPASAATPAAPGDRTAYAFDACVAPSTTVMDAWMRDSPYSAVGIYVSGNSRYCGDRYQPNLSKSWVQHNADAGWGFMPIHVGYQSPCFKNNPQSRVQKKRMSTSQTTARKQGAADAREAIAALKKYGFGAGSVAYLDIEWYARTTTCDNAVLAFSDAWTETLKASKFRSGIYSSGSAAIKLVDDVRSGAKKFSGFTQFDQVWFAWTNKVANVDGGPYLSDTGWKNARIHQFHNNVNETYGGHRLTIDRNLMRVGTGSVATTEPRSCGVDLTLASYPTLRAGSKGKAVEALQCLLQERGLKKSVTGEVGSGTVSGINAYRASKGWSRNGVVSRPVWTALLAEGSTPKVLKYGSTGSAVWRLQRSLRAAGYAPSVKGVLDTATVRAAQQLRRDNKQAALQTVTSSQWSLLRRGNL
ncbi:glycoside hydrolase domain-containing protein [Aeromicrobium sp. Leaf291]|uniref:glycoside hydrolase domain-containing protein n=1 Tax=Aeromicrobium sp. Leaf291 TaxID=1736325 RepID=UPI0009E690F6|nr:glycoside hydrolase domain-containing protein [Aeromicrobium sp. Leaf291]